jgi:hypothetical protein
MRSQDALAPLVAPQGHPDAPPVELTAPPMAYGQTPSASPPRKTAATATSPLRLAAREYTRFTAAPCHHLLCAGPHCPHAARGYKRRPSPCVCLRPPPPLPSSGKPSTPRRLFFRRSVGAKPPHPTSLLTCRSRSSVGPQSCSQTGPATSSLPLSSGAVDRTGELRLSVTRFPRFELEIPTLSGGFAVR